MNCPKCNKEFLTVRDCVNVSHNEIFRKKVCLNCGFTMFTAEFEVEPNERFLREWRRYHRNRQEKYSKD